VSFDLVEFVGKRFNRLELSQADGLALWQEFRGAVEVGFPSPVTDDEWQLTAKGYVGQIPIGETSAIRITPRVPVANIFRMWEVAYQVKFHWLDDAMMVSSLEEFYSELARHLGEGVLRRERQGLNKSYVERTDLLPFVRGRVDLREAIAKPWQTGLVCEFDEHTADIEDNQLLMSALRVAGQTAACNERARTVVRSAYWKLQRTITLQRFPADACLNRHYDRLNADYEPLHFLCHFVLDHAGPTHLTGSRSLRSFLVSMPLLFERFVAEWLSKQRPAGYHIRQRVPIPIQAAIDFIPDIAIYRGDTAVAVIDTKYKLDETPSSGDVQQVVAYAEALNCRDAILLFPRKSAPQLDVPVGNVRVRSLAFPLDGDLNDAGKSLIDQLGLDLRTGPTAGIEPYVGARPNA